ncbi:MAG: capsular polysaccharide biosynthesis protein [Shinella sp.]|nr:capsular polysaccharide biosynthesis protein [Shinella sp.]
MLLQPETPHSPLTGVDIEELSGSSVFAFHIHGWKRRILEAYFPGCRFQYIPFFIDEKEFADRWVHKIERAEKPILLVWSLNAPQAAISFARSKAIPMYFMEDGFIRSMIPNASRTAPFSLILDSKTPYFDSRGPSDLEDLLNFYDFVSDASLLERARNGIRALLNSKLTKYNHSSVVDFANVLGEKRRRRVLVIGQVENDASIKYGCDRPFTNNDLVRMAAAENPDCEIVYKPHPDVLNGVRKHLSDPAAVRHLCRIVTEPVPLPLLLETIDHAYAITSLAGFEALLRGIGVTVVGCPFYAGWGLTDDRQPNARRQRKLGIEELFAGAYLLYPRYFNPVTGGASTFEECLELMLAWREEGIPDEGPLRSYLSTGMDRKFEIIGPYGLFGWRHLLTGLVAPVIARMGDQSDVEYYRQNPIRFFREQTDPTHRCIGRILYPFGE